jgi:hypothetical protein
LFYSYNSYAISLNQWINNLHYTNPIVCSPDEVNEFPEGAMSVLNNNEAFLKNKIYCILSMTEFNYENHYNRNFYIEFENEKDALAFKLRI